MKKQKVSILEALLEEARTQFKTKGYRYVNIDELVQKVGISKTTFYKYFPSKEFLYQHTVEKHLEEFHKMLRRKIKEVTRANQLNFLKVFFEIMRAASEFLESTSKLISKQEEIRFPHLRKKIRDFGKKQIEKNFYLILNKGKELKIISSDVNDEILYHIINDSLINLSSLPNKLSKTNNITYIFYDYFSIIFNGILNDQFKLLYNNQIVMIKYETI